MVFGVSCTSIQQILPAFNWLNGGRTMMGPAAAAAAVPAAAPVAALCGQVQLLHPVNQ